MTTENPNKIDLSAYETYTEEGKERTKRLLDSVKVNMNNILTKDEQSYYIDEINFMLTGVRHPRGEVLENIEAGRADTDDMGGN